MKKPTNLSTVKNPVLQKIIEELKDKEREKCEFPHWGNWANWRNWGNWLNWSNWYNWWT